MSLYTPLPLFFGMFAMLFILMLVSFRVKGIPGIILSFISMALSFYMAQVVINGQLVDNIGGLNPATGEIVRGITIINIPALSYIFTFTAVVMGGLMIYKTWSVIQENNSKSIEIDF